MPLTDADSRSPFVSHGIYFAFAVAVVIIGGHIAARREIALPNHFPNGHHFRRLGSAAATATTGADESPCTSSASAYVVLTEMRMTSEGAGSV
jgi:hypothetical protein